MKNNYCNHCGKCCSSIAVDFTQGIMFRDGIQKIDTDFFSLLEPFSKKDNIMFCKCKFLKNNLCTNDKKPEICINYPSSPFAFLPDNCGFYGEIFQKKEEIMQKIRKLKEEILHYETLLPLASKEEKREYTVIIEKHKKFISKYKPYGSENW